MTEPSYLLTFLFIKKIYTCIQVNRQDRLDRNAGLVRKKKR